ncbi:F-box/LRR-repeat protein [Salix suchowensis]|nr:F-box/LRR-repeat protein [Salix suchowensis]
MGAVVTRWGTVNRFREAHGRGQSQSHKKCVLHDTWFVTHRSQGTLLGASTTDRMENMGQHGIDNDEQLFDFDPYEGSSTSPDPAPTQVLGEPAAADAAWGVSELEWCAEEGKGSTSIPMPARSAAVEHDVFDAAPIMLLTDRTTHSALVEHVPTEHDDIYSDSELVGTSKGKGKEREQPPTLPPLDFTPTELGGYDASNWPSTGFSPSSPGPSSYGSGYASLNNATKAVEQLPSIVTTIQPFVTAVASDSPALTRMPSRRRSLSHIRTHPRAAKLRALCLGNYFDEALPRELKLCIFQALVHLHEEDYSRAVRDGTWSMMKASSSKGRWVGRERGARELVKLSRVSRSWQGITLDGQLWVDLDLKAFPTMPTSLIKRLAETGGRFIRSVDLAGNGHVSSSALITLADRLCLDATPSSLLAYTQLTTVNLQGCSALTTRSLHHLLIRSPSLQKLVLKGLRAVTNMTLEILAVYCRRLTILDVSRCTNMAPRVYAPWPRPS